MGMKKKGEVNAGGVAASGDLHFEKGGGEKS